MDFERLTLRGTNRFSQTKKIVILIMEEKSPHHAHIHIQTGLVALCSTFLPVLPGLLLSKSVAVCLSPAGVSKAVENINKVIAPALVKNQVGPLVM